MVLPWALAPITRQLTSLTAAVTLSAWRVCSHCSSLPVIQAHNEKGETGRQREPAHSELTSPAGRQCHYYGTHGTASPTPTPTPTLLQPT